MPENTQFVPISTDIMLISRDEYCDMLHRSVMLDIIFSQDGYYDMGHAAEKLRDRYYPKPVKAESENADE